MSFQHVRRVLSLQEDFRKLGLIPQEGRATVSELTEQEIKLLSRPTSLGPIDIPILEGHKDMANLERDMREREANVHDKALALAKQIMAQFSKQGDMDQVYVRHKDGRVFVTGSNEPNQNAEIVYIARTDKTIDQYKAALIPILNKLPILEPDSNKIKEDDESDDENPEIEDIAEILLSDGVAMAIERGEGEKLPSLSGVEVTSWCRNNIPEWDKKVSSFINSNKEDLEKILANVKGKDDWVSSTVNSPSKAQDNAYMAGEEIVAKEFNAAFGESIESITEALKRVKLKRHSASEKAKGRKEYRKNRAKISRKLKKLRRKPAFKRRKAKLKKLKGKKKAGKRAKFILAGMERLGGLIEKFGIEIPSIENMTEQEIVRAFTAMKPIIEGVIGKFKMIDELIAEDLNESDEHKTPGEENAGVADNDFEFDHEGEEIDIEDWEEEGDDIEVDDEDLVHVGDEIDLEDNMDAELEKMKEDIDDILTKFKDKSMTPQSAQTVLKDMSQFLAGAMSEFHKLADIVKKSYVGEEPDAETTKPVSPESGLKHTGEQPDAETAKPVSPEGNLKHVGEEPNEISQKPVSPEGGLKHVGDEPDAKGTKPVKPEGGLNYTGDNPYGKPAKEIPVLKENKDIYLGWYDSDEATEKNWVYAALWKANGTDADIKKAEAEAKQKNGIVKVFDSKVKVPEAKKQVKAELISKHNLKNIQEGDDQRDWRQPLLDKAKEYMQSGGAWAVSLRDVKDYIHNNPKTTWSELRKAMDEMQKEEVGEGEHMSDKLAGDDKYPEYSDEPKPKSVDEAERDPLGRLSPKQIKEAEEPKNILGQKIASGDHVNFIDPETNSLCVGKVRHIDPDGETSHVNCGGRLYKLNVKDLEKMSFGDYKKYLEMHWSNKAPSFKEESEDDII